VSGAVLAEEGLIRQSNISNEALILNRLMKHPHQFQITFNNVLLLNVNGAQMASKLAGKMCLAIG
jgi:hypothetical protein